MDYSIMSDQSEKAWSWPALFERLVAEEGWSVVSSESFAMGFDHIVTNGALRFEYRQSKDADPRGYVRLSSEAGANGNSAEHPSDVASLLGCDVEDPFEAFGYISRRSDEAVKELRMLRLRRNIVRPFLLVPVLVLLLPIVFPSQCVRESTFGLIKSLENGPFRRAVYGKPSKFTKGLSRTL